MRNKVKKIKSDDPIKLLEAFLLDNKDLERLEELLQEFNIFSALGVVNSELRHSNFLSWLLNPFETHSLGGYFLSILLKAVAFKASELDITGGPTVFELDAMTLDDAEVLREWRKIDIFIKSDTHKLVCVIENKINIGEHREQLQRYREIITREFPDYKKLFVFLTLEGDIPSDNNYVPFSYREIAEIVERIIETKRDKLSPEIVTFISHYVKMLRRYFMEDSEIKELCRKIYKKHKKALDLLFEYKPDMQMEIYESLIEILGSAPDLILDDSSKTYIRFIPKGLDFIPKKGEGWTKSKRILLFEFQNTQSGLNLNLIIGPGLKDIREKLYDIARKNTAIFSRSRRKLTPQWFTIYMKSILKSKEYENKEIEEIKILLKEKFEKFKNQDLPQIVEVIKTHEQDIIKISEHSI